MGIRDFLVLVMGYACVPVALFDAYLGLLAYCWLSFMKPQSLVWSEDVQSARIVLVVAVTLIIRALVSNVPKFRLKAPTVMLLVFWAWVALCGFASPHKEEALDFLAKFSKIGIAVLLITGLVGTRKQLKWLIVLLALCPGLYCVKFGMFLGRGGEMTLVGGPIGLDSNDTALFMAMGFPLLVFGAAELRAKWARFGMYAAAALSVPAVIATGSRGGLLAVGAGAVLTLLRKMAWWKVGLMTAVAVPVVLALIPQQSMQRYETIKTYETDESAMGRIWAWETAFEMAKANPLVGVGLGQAPFVYQYDRYKANYQDLPHVAHSVWFSTMAGSGFAGLAIYLMLIVSVLLTTRQVRRLPGRLLGGKKNWARDYAVMIETTVATFAVGATFLSQVGFEFIYAIYMLSVPLLHVAEEEVSLAGAASRKARAQRSTTTAAPVDAPPQAPARPARAPVAN